MLLKVIVLFLVFMAVLGMFGKGSLPGAKFLKSLKCASCGKLRFGRPCDCKRLDR